MRQKKKKYKNLVVYASINALLRKNNIYAPKLFSHNLQKNVIIIEDFGNLSFNQVLLRQKNKLTTYKKLIDFLVKIQKIKPKVKLKTIINKSYVINKYSYKYLHKESDLFFDWYLPFFFNKKKCLRIKKETKKILSKLYRSLYFPNNYFVHRDYHSQNLMKVGKKIGIIDSQDALIGNPAYDLVSLIDDVRIKTSKNLKKKIYNYYLKKIPKIDSEKFLRDFNILSIQRSLKIIGIFSRLHKRDNKKRYVKFIPYTWKLIKNRMNSEFFIELKNSLDQNIPIKLRKEVIKK